MNQHPNIGSTLDHFLAAEGVLEQASILAAKRVIAWQLQEQMKAKGLTKTATTSLMNTSRNQLDRVLNQDDGNVTLGTLQCAAQVLGREVRLELA